MHNKTTSLVTNSFRQEIHSFAETLQKGNDYRHKKIDMPYLAHATIHGLLHTQYKCTPLGVDTNKLKEVCSILNFLFPNSNSNQLAEIMLQSHQEIQEEAVGQHESHRSRIPTQTYTEGNRSTIDHVQKLISNLYCIIRFLLAP